MKGFMKDKKFHPISNYTSVKRKKREPFAVTRDGVKVSQKELVQMQRADVGKRKQRDEEPILETELTDILEDVTGSNDPNAEINIRILEKVVKENIQVILEREKVWQSGYVLDIQLVTARKDSAIEGGFYQFDYQLSRNRKNLPLSGTVYGDISAGDLIDMTLELYDRRAW